MPKTQWVAGWNVPGQLPETPPETFVNWLDASYYLQDILNGWADDENCENDDDVPTETFMRAINTLKDLDSSAYNYPWESRTLPRGYVFWISRFSQKQTDNDYAGELADSFWSINDNDR